MLVDSHCHLDFPEFEGRMDAIRVEMAEQGVTHALCVSVSLSEWENVHRLAQTYDNFYASVGVHPDHEAADLVTKADLVHRAQNPKVVAIGETGLDYYRQTGDANWQRERFRTHIRAARETDLPLIIHTRDAAKDTLAIMREEGAEQVGGVMHCFTETLEVAEAAMAMNFYVSFSGIVTFKNAAALKEVACRVPLDRLLVETDAPYLAPVPYRGKPNHPAWVRYVAEEIARIRGIGYEAVATATTRNFFTLFRRATLINKQD
jgi:TatD DNase family protein